MNRHLVKCLLACAAILPATAFAQTHTGTPPGVAQMKSQNSQGFPLPPQASRSRTRAPEKADDKPAFAGQTRAHSSPGSRRMSLPLRTS